MYMYCRETKQLNVFLLSQFTFFLPLGVWITDHVFSMDLQDILDIPHKIREIYSFAIAD